MGVGIVGVKSECLAECFPRIIVHRGTMGIYYSLRDLMWHVPVFLVFFGGLHVPVSIAEELLSSS